MISAPTQMMLAPGKGLRRIGLLVTLAITMFASVGLHAADEVETRALMPKRHLEVFRTYCFDCHDAVSEEGNLNLEAISFDIGNDIPTAEQWAKVLNAINSGEMPPDDS
ncbi:MAG: c-type cytochrome domain-containing protein, partial [Rubripirellula sp.]